MGTSDADRGAWRDKLQLKRFLDLLSFLGIRAAAPDITGVFNHLAHRRALGQDD
jgi:hypothetical protein